MLPRQSRLRESGDFRETLTGGVRAGRDHLVVHMRANGLEHSRAGLVVSKKVGGAVIRNRVKRRLRHLLASELGQANHVDVVVRAFPGADRADLQPQLASALRACYRKLQA